MTCVVAVVDSNKNVFMAADSSAVDSNLVVSHRMPKVFLKDDFAIGYCHSFRLGQIVEYFFTPPPIERDSLVEYMIKDFIPELRSDLDVNSYPTHDDERQDWALMVGVRGHLFVVESDFHLSFDDLPYAAIGAGTEYALGAMYASPFRGAELALEGLKAAEKFSPFVRAPFNLINV